MNLVERDDELDLLRTGIDNCEAGDGCVILVSGPSGSGRTALLRAATRMARQRKFRVLSASATDPEKRFDVLDQLRGDPSHSPVRDVEFERTRFAEWCRERADETPVLVVVDDVDLADEDSIGCVGHVARRLSGAPVCLVLSRCDSRDIGEWWTDLERRANAHQCRLAPLSRAGVAQWKGSADTWYGSTGGSPLLLAALAQDDGVPGEGYGHTVLRCLRRGGPRLLAVARGVAVLDDDVTTHALTSLLDMDTGHVDGSLRRLREAGVLADHRFRCAAAAAAVVEDLPRALASDLRERAARLLHRQGAPAAAVARQLLATGTAAEWGVAVLEEAAATGDPDFAARCLTRAMAAASDAKVVARLRMRLAISMWQTDPGATARHLAPLVAACEARLLSGSQATLVCQYLFWHGRIEEALALLRQIADGTIPWDVDTPTALRIARLSLVASFPAYTDGAEPPRPRDTASPLGLRVRAAAALASIITHGPSTEQVTRAVELLDLLGDRHDHHSSLLSIQALVYADRADIAAEWTEVLPDRPVFDAVRAEIAVRLGDLRGACRHGRSALALGLESWGVAVGVPIATMVTAATESGRYAEAAELLRQPVPETMFGTRFALPYLHARGVHELAMGRASAALTDFMACGELMREWHLDQASLAPWRASAAQALLALNRPERARQLLDERPPEHGERSRSLAMRQVAACRPPAERVAPLTDAVDLAIGARDDLALAAALADLGATKRELGDEAAARPLLRRAYALASRCGAEPLCGRLRPSRRAPAGNGLTTAEGRVAQLAAAEYTNREIALRLHVTPSTVEQHLTRIFRKLEVKQRRDLPAALRRTANR